MGEINNIVQKKIKEITTFIESNDVKQIVGTEAVNHFKDSFENEGFTDKKLEKWEEVERRKKESEWYGHSGQTGKFSNTRTTSKILRGGTRELANAITFRITSKGVLIINSTKYAKVHNFGGKAYIYGKKAFIMKQRKFMGHSVVLNQKIRDKIIRELKKRLK